jgi:hypothetical protein
MTRIAAALTLALLSACASTTQVMVGSARPAISADQVRVYPAPPPKFEDIAVLDASAKSVFGTGGQKSVDKVVERLKVQAAKLGANGLILEGFSDRQSASIGTGVGSESYSGNSAVGVGAGGSFGVFTKTGKARAIFVPSG